MIHIERAAWKEAGWVFGLSQLLILLVTLIGVAFFPPAKQALPMSCSASIDPCLHGGELRKLSLGAK